MSATEKILANLSFDKAWFKRYKFMEQKLTSGGGTLHPNGLPLNYYLVFKIICIMKEEDMTMQKVAEKYSEVYGTTITQSSLSRSVFFLSDEDDSRTNRNKEAVMGVVTLTRDAFDHKQKAIRLTEAGRNLQKLLLGTTSNSNQKLKEAISV